MAHANPRNLISTVLLVTGALVFGEALHQSVVTGEASLFSQPILLALGLGTVLIVLGYWVRVPAEELTSDVSSPTRPDADDSSAGKPTPDADSEYDPRLSPLGNTPSDTRDRPLADDQQAADTDGGRSEDGDAAADRSETNGRSETDGRPE
ncbi:hypothetical protein [Haloprofundus salinisoli]|uniref:hypothetical protein n=1 Tax=Haloprofundus salinisoli TaxID=2876193 RepID=UPI001CC9462F|nr:hypothetical protein [Haloprofundus salinisoli]